MTMSVAIPLTATVRRGVGMEQQTVVAAFDRQGEAREAIDALLDDGFPSEKVRFGGRRHEE